MTYKDCVEYILSIPLFALKLGTDHLSEILEIMGHPERSYLTIHVAGTNGKGSTCSFLSSILQKDKNCVGLFTSPHLVKINERIRINDSIISDEEFIACFMVVKKYIELAKKKNIPHPSFFEFIFLMATVYFKNQGVDYAIFETGMGGTLDATNVLHPVLSIITSVGLDHMQYLGDTIEEIASQKAGIIKKNVPVVYFHRNFEATNVIRDKSEKVGTRLEIVEKSQYYLNEITDKSIDFSFDSGYYKYDNLKIRKTALYQVENAILAIKAFELLKKEENEIIGSSRSQADAAETSMKQGEIYEALLDTVWRGRMECISTNVYVDGAHNEEAIEAFCNTVEHLFGDRHKILLFAVSKDKDYKNMIARLCKIQFDEILIVKYKGDRAADLQEVKNTFNQHFQGDLKLFDSVKNGYLYGKNKIQDQVFFCVGSLYLVGDLLSIGD